MLGRCQFAEVVAAHPDTVCGLHLGVAEGLGGLAAEQLTPGRDPRSTCCQLTGRVSLAG